MLESVLESYPKPSKIQRNLSLILREKTCVYGAVGIGKTNAILNYFTSQNFHSSKKLYIDCADVRLNPQKDLESLKFFLKTEQISILILDNFEQSLPINLDLDVSYLILITNTPCAINGFYNLEVPPITFEEFTAIHKLSPKESLNLYLKFGNLLEQTNDKQKGNLLKLFTYDSINFWILRNLILHLGQKLSIHQIYTKLKRNTKISKDRFYHYCKFLQCSKILFWVEKFEHPSAPKKLYFWDFTIKNAISYEKNFKTLFENMVFLELFYHFELEVFYTDKLDFYLPALSLGIICAPFPQTLHLKLSKIGKEREFCDSLLIIALNDEEVGENLGMPYKIVPFSTFATTTKENFLESLRPSL